ncbi:MAG: NAD(P)-dependent glycerol-3-phosphate dehydrogenase [Dehalococcoidales bacterium]|nr:NAD(P)-dependent glycerol-3-phosphate dehydrogenase [Dehalococcoidales bacterium]
MIAVVGTGSWGTTLAAVLARSGIETTLLARTAAVADELSAKRENRRFLPDVALPANLKVTHLPEVALPDQHVVMLVVPAQRMRENVLAIRPFLPSEGVIVSAAKGLEVQSGSRMSEVIREELGSAWGGRIAALSGPNLAREVARGLPTATVVAAADEHVARFVQTELQVPHLRVYTNSDLVGVELAGAMKNIIALGAGICDGLGFGDNAKAAFLTRGLVEIARLGITMGANPLTFSGLAGLGDLVATCASKLSRNRHVGEQLGRGRRWVDIQPEMTQVAEGVPTTAATRAIARANGVEMPITEKMFDVLFEGASPREAVGELMTRDRKGELAGIVPQGFRGRGQK